MGNVRSSERRHRWLLIVLMATMLLARPTSAHADLLRGLMRIVGGVLEVPSETLAGTFTGPPIFGTAIGALSGVISGVGMVTGGALETLISAIPYAAKLAPLIPIFL